MPRTADLWRLQSGARVNDLVGYDVEATDGHIGKIDHTTEETDRNSVVVDTGFWIFGKKRLIPAGVVQSVDVDDEKVYVAMTKDQIKSAPDYDPDLHSKNRTEYQSGVGTYYDSYTSW